MSREQTITQYISTLLEKEGERGRFEKEAEKYKPKSGLMTNRNEPKKDEPVDTAPKVMSSSDHLFNAVEEMSRYVDDSGSDALTDSISRSVRIPNVPTSIDRRTPLVDLYRLNMGGETEQGFLKAPAAPVAPSIDTEGKGKPSFAQSMINSLRSRYQEKRINPNVKSLPEQDSITATELDGAAVGGASDGKVDEGLMSRPYNFTSGPKQDEVDVSFTNDFVKEMAESEGTEDHVDPLGISTLGYGILPSTARSLGFNPDDEKYQNREILATDVYAKMYQDAKGKYKNVFNNLTNSQKTGVLSLYINLGRLPTGVVNALSQETPDFEAAKTSLASVVLGSPRDDNEKRLKDKDGKIIYTASKGLSKRRAKEYNTLMKNEEGFKPVATVSVEGTKKEPTFVWKDEDDNEIHRYKPSINDSKKVYTGLDSSNSMKSVSVT